MYWIHFQLRYAVLKTEKWAKTWHGRGIYNAPYLTESEKIKQLNKLYYESIDERIQKHVIDFLTEKN